MARSAYEVKTEIFEGPMDLLIYLIRKNEVDIYDIPIALITDQFLQYIEWMKSMNIDFAGDFLVMAATLTHIKSRMLLPAHEAGEEEEDDPRLEITRPLLEYLRLKSAAEQLAERDVLGEKTFSRPPVPEEFLGAGEEGVIRVGLFELIGAFRKILENISPEQKLDLTSEKISIKDRIAEIIDALEEKGSVTLEELFGGHIDKGYVIVTFLAILEMAKMNIIEIAQHLQSGIIRIIYI
jgi:segregation and condensation protein A